MDESNFVVSFADDSDRAEIENNDGIYVGLVGAGRERRGEGERVGERERDGGRDGGREREREGRREGGREGGRE